MKKISFIMAIVFLFVGVVATPTSASGISPYYNNTATVMTTFHIAESGLAYVNIDYEGCYDIATGATVRIKIEKRNLLVFWTEVIVDIHYFREASHAETFVYQLEKSGTYRCTVEYLISGTGGADDEIVFQDTASY